MYQLLKPTRFETPPMFQARQKRFIDNYGLLYFKANDVLVRQIHHYEDVLHQTFTQLIPFTANHQHYYGFFYNQNHQDKMTDWSNLNPTDQQATQQFVKLMYQKPTNSI